MILLVVGGQALSTHLRTNRREVNDGKMAPFKCNADIVRSNSRLSSIYCSMFVVTFYQVGHLGGTLQAAAFVPLTSYSFLNGRATLVTVTSICSSGVRDKAACRELRVLFLLK